MANRTPQTNPIDTPTGLFASGMSADESHPPLPGVLLIWKPEQLICDDRISLERGVVVGRSSKSDWCIRDDLLSRRHFELTSLSVGRYLLKDLESKNGTFLNGIAVDSPRELEAGSVIQAGSCVFEVHGNLWTLASPGEKTHEQMAGRFHMAPLVRRLRVAARTDRHILIEGESGSGKELAAGTLHEVLLELGRRGPFVPLNAACFAGEDDAVATLLGVSGKAYTGVGERSGALAEADGGTLFLDEVHNLPPRAQRALLRFAEDGLLRQLGVDSAPEALDVRLVLGTNNLPVERACAEGRLAADLVARLHRVSIPPLRERKADIPAILLAIMRRSLASGVMDEAEQRLGPLDIERLCLHEFRRGNVRELEDMVAVIRARVQEGEAVHGAITGAFTEALGPSPRRQPVTGSEGNTSSSIYERNRREIIDTYRSCDNNLSHLVLALRDRGLKVNRRWLASYLDRWGVRKLQKRS